MISIKELNTFVNYVWDFYSPDSDLYPIKGLTKGHIYDAFFTYKNRILKVTQNMLTIIGVMVIHQTEKE